jgi:hypothetical protein
MSTADIFYKQGERGYTNPQKYNYSFSGTDAKVFAYFLGMENRIIQMNSLHTISISVHEAKGQVRSLGHRGIRGMTRSVRTIAGSIIARVIKEHPLAGLARMAKVNNQEEGLTNWSIDYKENGTGTAFNIYDYAIRLGTILPPFNLLFELSSESGPSTIQNPWFNNGRIQVSGRSADGERRVDTGEEPEFVTGTQIFNGASMMLEGVEIIDEGITVSVNDIMTEMTFTYVAKNFRPISDNIFASNGSKAIPLNVVRRREHDLHYTLFGGSGTVGRLGDPANAKVTALGSESQVEASIGDVVGSGVDMESE